MKFTQIPANTFKKLELNAGVLATSFSIFPSTGEGTLKREYIIGATSGGITVTAVPTFSDFGEDIDNCPKNTKEMKRITAWDIKASGTFVTFSVADYENDGGDLVQSAGARLLGMCTNTAIFATLTADTAVDENKQYFERTGSGTTASPYYYTPVSTPQSAAALASLYENPVYKLVPVHDFSNVGDGATEYDFADLWFVGDYSDVNDGSSAGYLACKIKNALSTGGFSMTTQDMEKGKFAFEFTGHYSIDDPEEVPFEMYVRTTST